MAINWLIFTTITDMFYIKKNKDYKFKFTNQIKNRIGQNYELHNYNLHTIIHNLIKKK